jgi:hypothetical protein
MASEERIDEYVDRPAVKDDTDFLRGELKSVLDLFDKVNNSKISLSGAQSLKDVTKNTEATQKAFEGLTAENKKLQKAYDDLAKKVADLSAKNKKSNDDNKKSTDELEKAKAKLAASESKQAKEIALVNQQRIEQNKLLKIQATLENAVAGSVEYARAKVADLTLQRNVLNITTEAGKKKQAELNAEIDQYNEFIKENVDALAKQKINIGNYQGSAKIIVDALERARQKVETLSKAGDPGSGNLRAARTEFEALRQVVDGKEFLSYAGKVGDAQKEVKAFTRVLIDLERRNEGNSEAAIELRKHLAELTDQVADTKAEVKALSSDTRTFDLFAGSVNFAADAFQTFAGAAALSADSEEDVQEVTKTLLAIQTTANGVKGIANELTTRGTAANKVYAFAQNQVAIAMDTTATAGARLRAALITIGIGALIIGIGLLVANFSKLKDALSGISETQRILNDINKKAIDGYVQERIHVEALAREVNNETTSKQRKKEIIKELNDLSPTYFSNIKSETDLQDKLNESVVKYVKAIELKARAKAAENALGDTEKPIIERQIELQRQLAALNDKTFDTDERKKRSIEGLTKRIEESNKALSTGVITENVDNEIAYLIKQRGPIQKIITDINAELDGLGGDPNKAIQLPFVSTKKARTGDLEDEAAAYEKLSAIEDAYLTTRLGARENAFDLRKQILEKERDVQLQNLNAQIAAEQAKGIIDVNTQKGFDQTRLGIQGDFEEKRKKLKGKYDEDILNIGQSFIARQREQDQQDRDQFIKDKEEKLKAEVDNLLALQEDRFLEEAKGREVELKALDEWYTKRVAATREGSRARNKVEEKYAQERAEIEYRYAVAALKTQIEFADKILQAHKVAGIDVTEEEKRLSELRMQLSDIETKHAIDNEKKKAKTRKETLEEIKAGIEQAQEIEGKVAEVIGGLISANVDRQKNAIQEQIDALDKKKEKEIEAINASTASEKDKADKIAIVEARAAAQKESLERRQRQLELQRARFEKAKNIADIILRTAVAVMDGLIKGGPPLAIAYGAIGAAELAVAIATPLPKFKHGREKGPATWAITGDGGVPEVATSPDLSQAFLTPSTDTVTYLPKNWKVFPNVQEFQDAAVNMVHKPLQSLPVINNNNDGLIRAMAYEIGGLKRAIMGKQETHFHWDNGQLQKSIKNGNDWWRYIQNNI